MPGEGIYKIIINAALITWIGKEKKKGKEKNWEIRGYRRKTIYIDASSVHYDINKLSGKVSLNVVCKERTPEASRK